MNLCATFRHCLFAPDNCIIHHFPEQIDIKMPYWLRQTRQCSPSTKWGNEKIKIDLEVDR